MKKIIVLLFIIAFAFTAQAQKTFTLTSTSIGGQATKEQEFNSFGCNGQNISPQLSWKNAPKGTKSFAITIHDADAPTGSGFWHWLVVNLPANTSTIAAGVGEATGKLLPKGTIQTVTDFGGIGYGGPCPPKGHGWHTYTITIHALSVDKLDVVSTTNPAVVGFNCWANTIEKASLVMYYKR